jgi:hypothetical protein
MFPVVLVAVSGLLLGGAWSMRSQGAPRGAVILVVVFAVLALASGVLWLLPKETFR